MSTLTNAFQSMADIRTWLSYKTGTSLQLADVPSLIPYYWDFFKENWESIKRDLISNISAYTNPELLTSAITAFDQFMSVQRSDRVRGNPFSQQNLLITYYPIFDSLSVSIKPLTNTEQKIYDQAITRVSFFTKNDFLKCRANIQSGQDLVADSVGGTDPDYNRIVGRVPATAINAITPVDIQNLQYFMDFIGTIDSILVNFFQQVQQQRVDPFALARINANNPEFNLRSANVGNLCRMNFGEDLRSLAARYLGDGDRWLEIALTNGLKPPYVDEYGEQLPILTNGRGNQVNFAKFFNGNLVRGKLYVNQAVFLKSGTQPILDQRTILSIKEIDISGELIVELDGEPDLDRYTAPTTTVQVFAPNTISSNFLVMIPAGIEATPIAGETPWFLHTKKEDERQAQIDLLINDNGDLNLSPTGDLAISYGLINAIQAMRIKMSTEREELFYAPTFGLQPQIGKSTANVNQVKNALSNNIVNLVERDPRFSQVISLNVTQIMDSATSGFLVKLVVKLAGTGTAIPVSFAINSN